MWWTPCWELGLEEAVLTSEGTEAARGSNRNPGTVSGTVSVLSGKSGTVLTKPENIDNLFFNLLRILGSKKETTPVKSRITSRK